jgi:predicted helicase
LHGSARKKELSPDGSKDENVFDIQQGVSIIICIKLHWYRGYKTVWYADLYGTRQEKYEWLLSRPGTPVKELIPEAPNYFFINVPSLDSQKWKDAIKITDLFPLHSNGIKTQKDEASIHFSKNECKTTINDFKEYNYLELKERYGFKDVRDWTVQGAKEDIEKNKPKILPIEYRPFDTRYCIYTGTTKGIMGYPRYNIMKHMLDRPNVGLICSRQFGGHRNFIAFIANKLVEISSQPYAPYTLFPLYLYPESGSLDSAEQRRPNLNMEIVNRIAAQTGLHFISEKETDEGATENHAFAPIDVLDYVYAVLYSNKYRETWSEFLKIDFPRVPYPENAAQFQKLAAFGATLRHLHLLENVHISDVAAYPVKGNNTIDTLDYKTDSVYINREQYFAHIPPEVWNCQIGGYQPAQKWLKDRKGRTLDIDEIEHYQKIITALRLTIDLQAQIDATT